MKFFISPVNISTMNEQQLPFLFGAQYYRAPTPERECWATDLAKMKDLGFTQVKYWVQWRWAHRAQDRFYWDDLDELMDLAAKNGIGVTLNTIMDVSPRCYEKWEEVELPRQSACVTDFIDWREFHLDTMTAEARWRLQTVRELDPKNVAYLHVVPNTMTMFNSVTGVDDFDIAPMCDIWAATMNQ